MAVEKVFDYFGSILRFAVEFYHASEKLGWLPATIILLVACFGLLAVAPIPQHFLRTVQRLVSVFLFAGLFASAMILSRNDEPKIPRGNPPPRQQTSPDLPKTSPCSDSNFCGQGGPDIDPRQSFDMLLPGDIVEAVKTESSLKKSFVCNVFPTPGQPKLGRRDITVRLGQGAACQRYFNAKTVAVQLTILASPSHGRLHVDGRHFIYEAGTKGSDQFTLQQCTIGNSLTSNHCIILAYSVEVTK